jgi:hypothetical protein
MNTEFNIKNPLHILVGVLSLGLGYGLFEVGELAYRTFFG